ncbi:MAG: hypothetical protein QGG40_03380, partial [Myxococcota bacterium]|nr:hypothetical protein [Myxococcota bacterium]
MKHFVARCSALVLGLAGATACAPEPPTERVVVVAMDGLERSLLMDLMEAGSLPTFGRLVQTGRLVDLDTIEPM